jgi:hypothetical protein
MEDTTAGGDGLYCDGAAEDKGVPVFAGTGLPLLDVAWLGVIWLPDAVWLLELEVLPEA